MAAVSLTLQTVDHQGTAITYAAGGGAGSGNGWSFANDGDTYFECQNFDTGGTKTLTLKANGARVDGIALADKTATVPAATASAVGYVKVKLGVAYFGATVTVEINDVTGAPKAAVYK
jgi:hypothetical protein